MRTKVKNRWLKEGVSLRKGNDTIFPASWSHLSSSSHCWGHLYSPVWAMLPNPLRFSFAGEVWGAMRGLDTGSEPGHVPDSQSIHIIHFIKLNTRCLYMTNSLLIVSTSTGLNTSWGQLRDYHLSLQVLYLAQCLVYEGTYYVFWDKLIAKLISFFKNSVMRKPPPHSLVLSLWIPAFKQ